MTDFDPLSKKLEIQVQERITELEKANQELRAEILERKRAEEQLRYHASLIDNVSDAIISTDKELKIQSWNGAAERIYGWQADEVIGLKGSDILQTTFPEGVSREAITKDIFEKGHWEGELIQRTEDGRNIIVYAKSMVLKDEAGSVIGGVSISFDITKRKQAEQSLQEAYEEIQAQSEELQAQTEELGEAYQELSESERHYRMLFTNMTEGFALGEMICDTDGKPYDYRFLEINPAYERKLGVKKEQAVGKSILEAFPNETPITIEEFGKVALSGEVSHFEVFNQANGKYLDTYAFSPEKGKFATIVRDITERKRAEEALQEIKASRKVAEAVEAERKRLISVLNMLPVYVILLSPDYHVPFANRFFEERFGKSEGKRCYEYLFQRTEPCENCETYKVLKTGSPHHWEWIGPDGHNYDIYDYPFKDADGSSLIMEVGIDITEMKQAQVAVQAERQRLFDVLDTLPAMICLLTPDYHYAFTNRNFREKFGELNGRHCYEYCFGLTKPCEFCQAYKVLETGKSHYWEVTTPDGSIIDVHNFPFTDVDGSQLILEMDIDITDRKKAEEALEKSEKARIKEIHHRIKNNLQVISSLLDLQAERFKDQEVLEAFLESQNRVISMALIHEELYKGTDADTLNFASYLQKLTKNLLSSYQVGNYSINLNLDLEQVYLSMDVAIPLGIIVNELFSNSLKHAFPYLNEAEINISLQKMEDFAVNKEIFESDLSYKENSFCYMLRVADNGKGIPEEIDPQDTETLGLQLVNILADQIDGELEMKRDNGTEFIIRFAVKEG